VRYGRRERDRVNHALFEKGQGISKSHQDSSGLCPAPEADICCFVLSCSIDLIKPSEPINICYVKINIVLETQVISACRIQPSSMENTLMQTLRYKTSTFKDAELHAAEYDLAVEELLEIYIDDVPYSITMRLPGDDINLVTGFCFTEGLIDSWDDVVSIVHCDQIPGNRRVLVRLNLENGKKRAAREKRNPFLSKSSCGICGKSSAEEIYSSIRPVESFHRTRLSDILRLKQLFETSQTLFELTGSTHAAAIFDRKENLLAVSEDIGRHNAFDKAIGSVIRSKSPKEPFLAIVSSRLSFEMVQKAGVLGLEIIAGLSGPTSMAVRMAEDLNITLIGFLRENSMTIYTHPERILSSPLDSKRSVVMKHALLSTGPLSGEQQG